MAVSKNDFVDVHCRMLANTPNAAKIEQNGEEYWIPWSVIDEGSIDRNGQVGIMYIKRWKAANIGLEYTG